MLEYTIGHPYGRAEDRSGEWYTMPIGWLISQLGGSAQSWQGHIIFLIDAGLLIRVKPDQRTTIPRMAEAYEEAKEKHRAAPSFFRVPDYTPALLAFAEAKAALWRSKGISISTATKADLIASQGQQRANELYRDGRTVGKAELWAQNRIKKKMLDQIEAKGYTTPEAIFKAIKTHGLPEGKFAALLKQKTRITKLTKEAGCLYKPPAREQREKYGLKDGSWIIVKAEKVKKVIE